MIAGVTCGVASMKPDRIVLGSDNADAIEAVKELYEPFMRTGNPILAMDSRSALKTGGGSSRRTTLMSE